MRRTGMADFREHLEALVADYRSRCLWDLKDNLDLDEPEVVLMVLGRIESCADLKGYARARSLRRWLSRSSSHASAVS